MKKKLLVMALVLTAGPVNLPAAELAAVQPVATMAEVVVTATKSAEKRSEVVNSVVILDSVEIEESTGKSVGELLANEPGVDLRSRGNYGGSSEEIQIRGMDADGTQVLLNGVALNSASLGSADVSQIPLNYIDRIEIVKGPGSLLYGSGAMGGTINIITKRPRRGDPYAKVEAGYGTEATYHLAAENGAFVTGDFGYYLTANHVETDGFRDNSDLDQTDLSLNLVLDKGEKLDLSFFAGYLDRKYGLPGPVTPENTTDYSLNGETFSNSESANLLDRGEDRNRLSTLEAKGRALDWLDWRLKGSCSVQEGFNHSRYSYNGTGDETVVTNTVRGLESNVDLQPLAGVSILLGNEYRDFTYENEQQTLDSFGLADSGGRSSSEHGVFTSGTFVELNYKPVAEVKLVTGYRYEDHSLFGNESVARYGMVVKPVADTAIKINHGSHFKAPTMNDLFWPDTGYTKGNLDLKPETGWHSDLTVEQSLLDDMVFATVSWFKWDIADKIDWAEDPNQPALYGSYWVPSNVDSYRATGLEANIKVGPYRSVMVDLGLTLLDAEEEKDGSVVRQALYSPDTQFKCRLNHLSDFDLTSSLTIRHVSARPGYYASDTDSEAEITLASYWTVDLKLEQRLKERWLLSLLATNLLDEEYDTFLASFTDQTTFATTMAAYQGAGRSVFVSAAYEF